MVSFTGSQNSLRVFKQRLAETENDGTIEESFLSLMQALHIGYNNSKDEYKTMKEIILWMKNSCLPIFGPIIHCNNLRGVYRNLLMMGAWMRNLLSITLVLHIHCHNLKDEYRNLLMMGVWTSIIYDCCNV